jgi:hypothetical protein
MKRILVLLSVVVMLATSVVPAYAKGTPQLWLCTNPDTVESTVAFGSPAKKLAKESGFTDCHKYIPPD